MKFTNSKIIKKPSFKPIKSSKRIKDKLKNNKLKTVDIALYEAIISKVCETKGYDINEHKQREEAKKRVNFPYNKLFNTQTNKKDNLNSISQIRNSIVHQDNKRKDVVDQDINRLKTFLDEFKSFFK